jgi:membrane protease YdiL (CAAX protease family)
MNLFLAIYAGMVVVAAALAAFTGCPSLFRAPVAGREWSSLVAGIALALFVVQLGVVLEPVPWYRRMADKLREIIVAAQLLGPRFDKDRALVVAVYSSVGEEALFRGFVQPFLILKLSSIIDGPLAPTVLGILATGVVFGLLHFPRFPELRPWTAFAVIVGLLFGALAAWSQSLLAPVVAHLVINWLNLRRLADLRPSPGPT